MRVKELITLLQAVDSEMPVHRLYNGEYPEFVIKNVGTMDVMQSKNDNTYFGDPKDKIWEKHLDNFHKPFKAVIIV